MSELTQSEVFSPQKPMQAWRTLLSWLALAFQIFFQIVRRTPQVLSYVGLGQHSILSAASPSFKPLPVVELAEHEEEPLALASVEIGDDGNEKDVVDGSRGGAPEKFTVVLDLDETLVCAYETSSLPAVLRSQATEAGLTWFELECLSSDKESDGKPKLSYVTVFERPGLHEFLKQLSQFAELVLFTAGLEGYASPLVDRIDEDKVFGLRLYRPSTISTEYRDHVKDLSSISKDLSRIVIVDNNPFSFLLQPLNGIPCIPFSAGQPQDVQLLDSLLPLLKYLSEQRDVRPVLHERFHMPEWFQKHGIPATSWT
ncbi:unnamed protein product [Rhodiola kirilowii]